MDNNLKDFVISKVRPTLIESKQIYRDCWSTYVLTSLKEIELRSMLESQMWAIQDYVISNFISRLEWRLFTDSLAGVRQFREDAINLLREEFKEKLNIQYDYRDN